MIKTYNKGKRLLCLLLALSLCLCLLPGVTARAAGTPTSIGMAEHGIKAFTEKWRYRYGAKGAADSNGTRYTDCAGLLFAYFSDLNAIGRCQGGATAQVNVNCVFSGNVDEGIPNIHGLALTSPDYYDPGTGIYGHIGIYIGNNEACDNSDSTVNMLRGPVVGSNRGWNAWHVFDNGMKYPVSGWYAFDGKMVHYTNYEYDVNTAIDGYAINSAGFAEMPGGGLCPVDPDLLSDNWGSASDVAAHLSQRYSGKDNTYELIYGSGNAASDFNGKVIGSGVRLRAEPNTSSSIRTTLQKGARLKVLSVSPGESITSGGKTSTEWYEATTTYGITGFISSLFVELLDDGGLGNETADPESPEPPVENVTPGAPVVTAKAGYVTMTASPASASVFYTTDGSQPTENSIPYSEPIFLTGQTYKAVAVLGDKKSGVTTATVLSSSMVFNDFTTRSWFFKAVDKAVDLQIFRGNGDGTFSPESSITRAQFVMALANLDRVDLSLFSANQESFTDTGSLSAAMSRAVNWAVATGVVKGYSDGTFRPNEAITREQMCVILTNYAGLQLDGDPDNLFADDGRISSWAKKAVYACRAEGIISGVGANSFDPQGTATRAQACVITVNLYNL